MCINCLTFALAQLIISGHSTPVRAQEYLEVLHGADEAEKLMARVSEWLIRNERVPLKTLALNRVCNCQD